MNNQSLFRHQAWTINASLVCALLLHACAAQVRDPADDATDPHVSEALATSKAITGTINSAGTSWVSHKMAMTGPTDVEATLSWTNTSADLNLYVYVDGVLKGYSNKSARPETVKLTGLVGKELSFGIKARSGGISSYSLAIKLTTPDPAPPPATSTTLTGSIDSGGTSWRSHKMTMTGPTDVNATLSWTNASADLNLYVYVDGVLKGYSNKSARPEVVKLSGLVGKELSFGIKARTGGVSAYSLAVVLSAPAAEPPPPPPPATCATDPFPGRPSAGKVLWGAAVSGNGDPTNRHEIPGGHPLSVRRTFFAWDKRATSMVTMARNDLTAGRIPWVSTKTPSWADMAAGKHDAEIDQMLLALDALPGPVWLTIHHEPEGGNGTPNPDDPAGPAGHLAMNKRVRQRMTALKTHNISLAVILMSWTWDSRSGRDPNQWYEDGVYDILGIDHYRDSTGTLLTSVWNGIRVWADDRCIPIAVGEWGVRGTDAAAAGYMKEWYEAAAGSATDGKGAPVLGLSAFDSSLNSPSGSWELVGEQLTMFHKLLGDPRTARIGAL